LYDTSKLKKLDHRPSTNEKRKKVGWNGMEAVEEKMTQLSSRY